MLAAILGLASAARADYVWNGGGTTTDWSDAANWTGSSGNWVNKVSGSTVTFTNAVAISSGVWVENGVTNGESMVTWKKGTDAEDGAGLTDGTTLTIGTATKGGLKIDDGDYTFSGTMYLGNGANGQGAVVMNGGHLKVGGELNMSRQNNSQSEFVMNGGLLEVTSWFAVSRANAKTDTGCVSIFTVNDGVVTNSNSGSSHMSIGTVGSASNYGELIVNGGEVYASAIPYIAEISPGKLTVNGGKFTTPSSMQIGMAAGVTGAVEVAGGELKSSGTIQVGYKSGGYGNFLLSDGNVNAYTLNVGALSGANGEMTMSGGTVTCSGQFNVGIQGSTATYNQTGGTVNAATGWLGADNNTHAVANISGGEMNFSGQLALGNGNNAYMELNVNGGTLNLNADPLFGQLNGSGSTNVVTISNGGVLNVGSETAAKWMKVNSAGTAANEFYLNDGGTLAVWHIEKVSTDTGSKIVFDGGTLKSLGVDSGNNTYIIENDDTLSVEVTEHGGIIDVNGHAVNLPKAITGTGTLTITNSSATAGSIAFSANVEGKIRLVGNVTATFADGVTIGGFELGAGWSGTLPAAPVTSYTLDGGALTMAYGELADSGTNLVVKSGTITLDMSAATEVEVGSTAALANVSLADGVDLSAITFNTSGTAYNWTASLGDDGVITMTAVSAKEGNNKWVGPTSGGNWSDNANWDFGIPTADQTVEFDYDVNVILDGATGSDKTVSNVVLNADVQLSYNNGYLSLYFYEINGAHKISLYRTGLKARGNYGPSWQPSRISADTTVEILPYSTDSWIEGTGYSNQPLYIYGKITGAGYIIFRNYIYFYGDNSGHTGKVVFQASNDSRYFMSAESGFANSSSVSISGSSYFGFTEGTIKFNNLTYLKNGGYRGFNVLNGAAIMVELTGTSYLNDNVSFFESGNTDGTFGSWKNGCATCTIKNSGTLTTTTQYAYTLDCAADSYTTINADNISAAIKVADGATLSGNAMIAAPTFAGSAVIAQAVSWDTTSDTTGEGEEELTTVTTNGLKITTLKIDGAVDVSKLTFKVTNSGELPAAVKGAMDDWTVIPTFLTATSITGAPATEKTTWLDEKVREGYQPTGSATRYGWQARVGAKVSSAVYLDSRDYKPGFAVSIR